MVTCSVTASGNGLGQVAAYNQDNSLNSAAKPAHLAGVGLDDGLADRDLAVAADGDEPALANGQDRGAVPGAR